MTAPVNPPVIVAGFGRCGSSLVMQMLHAAGFPVTGEYPSFECEEFHIEGARPPAGASKMLSIDCVPPVGGPYRWIWLDRSPAQQAKSQAKMLRELGGIRISRSQVRALARSYAPGREDSFEVMKRLGGPILSLTFEEIVTAPRAAAERIARFIGSEQIEEMTKVIRKRPPECLPYLLETELLSEVR